MKTDVVVIGRCIVGKTRAIELAKSGARVSIVNLGINAESGAKKFCSSISVGYSMTKHALLAITQTVRLAGWEGVGAKALCPGAIDTQLIGNMPGVTPKADRLMSEIVVGIVAFIMTSPNQASIPESTANTRLETLI